MIIPLIFQLLGIGLIIILAVGVLSPFESMGWWAGWSEESKPELPEVEPPQETPGNTEPEFNHYVVYLSGIDAISGDFLGNYEIAFLDKVGAATYLRSVLKAPILIISLGGVMADDPSFLNVRQLYHFHGQKDPEESRG